MNKEKDNFFLHSNVVNHIGKEDYNKKKKIERKTGLGPATPTLARLCSTN